GFDIDTNHFLGNHPPFASIEACNLQGNPTAAELENNKAAWKEILPKSPLAPGSQNFYSCDSNELFTHVKLHIYPDGGVARLKVYGEVKKDWTTVSESEEIDLASALNGAKSVLCNDMFFSHMDNLIMPSRGINMGDGWETKRNRTPNNRDWVIVRLAHPGIIRKIMVDTCHFKGNYPDTCSIEGCAIELWQEKEIGSGTIQWKELLPKQKLQADHEHFYESELIPQQKTTHVRLNIFPDGGISRMRLWGHIVKD
ncbi:MAG: allantoicase, partial [Bacteroidota bacterium]